MSVDIVSERVLSCVVTQNKAVFGDRSGSPKLAGKQRELIQTTYRPGLPQAHSQRSGINKTEPQATHTDSSFLNLTRGRKTAWHVRGL